MHAEMAKSGTSRPSSISHAVDMRSRMEPRMPEHSAGNIIWEAYAHADGAESTPEAKLVEQLRKSFFRDRYPLSRCEVVGRGRGTIRKVCTKSFFVQRMVQAGHVPGGLRLGSAGLGESTGLSRLHAFQERRPFHRKQLEGRGGGVADTG